MLNGLKNFLQFINDNWTSIVVIISLLIAIGRKVYTFLSKSKDEKIAIAKAQIKETILKMITDAEVDYEEWNKAGSIKRSQVIAKIFSEYPVLSKVANQEDIIAFCDEMIDEALKELRQIVKENKQPETTK